MRTILMAVGFTLLASMAYAGVRGAPWVPTWKKDLERIKRLANLQEGERFIELGCGNGRVCRYIARETKAQSAGIELSLLQWMVAKTMAWRSGTKIFFGDVFHRDLSKYNVVYMFLMPETYVKLRDKLTRELPSGARVISYVWPIEGWQISHTDHVDGSQDIFVYVKK